MVARLHDVCSIHDVPEGQGRMFVVDKVLIGLFRVGDEFFALDNHCPHAGASLARGCLDGDVVECRIHHWRFCVRDGVYQDEDKAAFNARTYPVRVNGERVQVEL